MAMTRKHFLAIVFAIIMMLAFSVPAFAADYAPTNISNKFWSEVKANPYTQISYMSPFTAQGIGSYSSTVSVSRNSNLTGTWQNYTGSSYTLKFTNVRWRDPTVDDTGRCVGSLRVTISKKTLFGSSDLSTQTQNFNGDNETIDRPSFTMSFPNAGSGERRFSFSTSSVAFSSDLLVQSY